MGEEIGVGRQKAREWLEPVNPRWEGTGLHAEDVKVETADNQQSIDEQVGVSDVGSSTLYKIRNATKSVEDAMILAEKVGRGEFAQRDVQQVKRQQERGESFAKAVENVEESREGRSITRTVTFNGRVADALDRCGKDDATSDQEVIREAVKRYLEERGYL